jgi:flagellar assembly protein FliH
MGIESVVFEEIPDSGSAPLVIPFSDETPTRQPIEMDMARLNRLRKQQHAAAQQYQTGAQDIEEPPAPTLQVLSPEQMDELYARLRRDDAEIEAKVQQAYEKGLADGTRNQHDIEKQLAERYAYGLEKLHMLGKSVETLARHEALEVALMIAKRIMQVEIEMRPMVLVEQVKRAARELMGKKELTIHLHPADLSLIRSVAPDFSDVFPAVAQVTLMGDDDLERGDCVIDTEVEQINMTLAEQLSVIKRALQEELR